MPELEAGSFFLGSKPLPLKVFLRFELPLGATPLNSFLESFEVKLTKIAGLNEAVVEPLENFLVTL